MVARQISCTVAVITSEVVHGVLLAVIARKISEHEGHEPALAADVTLPRGGITEVGVPGRV